MRELLFIHGAGDNGDDPNDLATYLKDALSETHTVSRPQLPEPDARTWGDMIADMLAMFPPDGILVGHSFGGSMLLKVIAEHMPEFRAAGLVIASAPFWGEPDWDYPEAAVPNDFATSLKGVGQVVFAHGRDDEVVSFTHLARYTGLMPRAKVIALEGVRHAYHEPERAQLAEAIRSI